MLRILVAGGSGNIGRSFLAHAANFDVAVTILSRSENRTSGVETVPWDSLDMLTGRFDAVVNLSGSQFLNPTIRWNEKTQQEIVQSRVGTASKLKAFVESDPHIQRFIQITGVGMYPYSETKTYTELSEISRLKDDFFQSLVFDWEVGAATDRTTIIRSGVVLSSTGGAFKEQLPVFRLGLGSVIGSGRQFFPWIHEKDLARLIMHSITSKNRLPLLNGVAPNVITQQCFCQSLKQALGRPQWFPPFAVPGFAIKVIFGGSDRADFLLRGMAVKPDAVLSSGFHFNFPSIDEAIVDLLAQ